MRYLRLHRVDLGRWSPRRPSRPQVLIAPFTGCPTIVTARRSVPGLEAMRSARYDDRRSARPTPACRAVPGHGEGVPLDRWWPGSPRRSGRSPLTVPCSVTSPGDPVLGAPSGGRRRRTRAGRWCSCSQALTRSTSAQVGHVGLLRGCCSSVPQPGDQRHAEDTEAERTGAVAIVMTSSSYRVIAPRPRRSQAAARFSSYDERPTSRSVGVRLALDDVKRPGDRGSPGRVVQRRGVTSGPSGKRRRWACPDRSRCPNPCRRPGSAAWRRCRRRRSTRTGCCRHRTSTTTSDLLGAFTSEMAVPSRVELLRHVADLGHLVGGLGDAHQGPDDRAREAGAAEGLVDRAGVRPSLVWIVNPV